MRDRLTASQARAARAMLGWSVRELASRCKISESSIRRIEVGFDAPENVTLDMLERLKEFFESRGIKFTFVPENGPGVARKRPGHPRRRAGDKPL
jgi:transcriptional regulator with XRE-family HTH domain